MKIGISGTPGVGKSSVSKLIGKYFKLKVLNEKEFSLKEGIGEFDVEADELVVELEKLEEKLNQLLKKEDNVLIEGHMLCEIEVDFDYLVIIRCHPEILESRIEAKGYKAEKVQDNVFCEGIEYCKKYAERNYPKEKLIEIESGISIKETSNAIIEELEKRENK